jgi:uncharacterized membrane protein YadS
MRQKRFPCGAAICGATSNRNHQYVIKARDDIRELAISALVA